MTKNDIIKEVSKETGFTNVEVELILDNIVNRNIVIAPT